MNLTKREKHVTTNQSNWRAFAQPAAFCRIDPRGVGGAGQLERGEKNATIETVCKLADALNVPAAQLFAHLPGPAGQPSPAEEIYQLVQECPPREQQALLVLLRQLLQYKRL